MGPCQQVALVRRRQLLKSTVHTALLMLNANPVADWQSCHDGPHERPSPAMRAANCIAMLAVLKSHSVQT